jgi:xanthine dehydrogenase accessory factor
VEKLFQAVMTALQQGETICTATIVAVQGSAPRQVGSKMLIRADGSILGSIGGGATEAQAIQDARQAIAQSKSVLRRYVIPEEIPLAARSGELQPERSIEVFLEVLSPSKELLLIGGGHVAHAMATLASPLGWRITVSDDRAEFANQERFPMAARTLVLLPGQIPQAVRISTRTGIVIATRDHAQDEEALRVALESPAYYIGLVSSRAKARTLLERLQSQGVNKEQLACVYTPIGLDIGSETPAEIALSILAEMLLAERGGSGRPLRESRNPLFRSAHREAAGG